MVYGLQEDELLRLETWTLRTIEGDVITCNYGKFSHHISER